MPAKSRTHPLRGKRILITAGPTWEMIDPVRFLSNRSSGLMGLEIAKAAVRAGAKVTLVIGPTAIRYPVPGTRYLVVVRVISAREMYRACLKHFPKVDVAILTAAVSDYRPAKVARHKIKKCLDAGSSPGMTLKLVRNPDILATLGKRKTKKQTLVGFALESRNMIRYAQEKLQRKNCDLIVANPIPTLGAATNTATLLFKGGRIQKLPKLPKSQLATRILITLSSIDQSGDS